LSAGQKHSKAPQPLTLWRAKDRHCQQARNTAKHHSHSQTGEPRTGIVSRPETQQGTTATQPLTSWRAKDRHCQQARNTARHHSHSHPGEPRTGIVSRPETQQGTTATHINWRAKDRHCQQARNTARHHSHSHPGEPRTGIVSRPETQQGTTATHILESQGQALSAGQKHSKAPQPLTSWRAKDRHCQEARNTARHHNHSPTAEQIHHHKVN
jgi:hypothetical protein